ncbi:MAG: trypsin-like peptidase domain-containing protein [Parasporobacterium sp.]|nr:trypsin-like peptidase domain-containing protein [Parasporobacterium sp.]
MNDYNFNDNNFNDYNFHQENQPQNPERKTQSRKKNRRPLRTLGICALSVAVLLSCTLSLVAINKSKTSNNTPIAATASQPVSASASDSAILLTDVSDIVKAAMPSVVSITSRALVSNYGMDDILRYIMGGGKRSMPEEKTEEVESGIGSGTIVGYNDKELLILTSYHVVEGCSSLYVTFNDNASVDGYIKSKAEDKDIAIVAVPLDDITEETRQNIAVAKLCEDDVEVGDGIVIIGNALGYGQSAITGIISATGREVTTDNKTMSLLQTDAAINAGNSGGCMLNAKGEIVGIGEAKITDASVEGMCYAIPIKENLDLIHELMGTDSLL